jgi:acyl dehydratase
MSPRAARTLTLDELPGLAGTRLGVSDPVRVTQERINQFADATGDHQWIHVDLDRAASGPFGSTIAHGYLTLSLGPMLLAQVFEVTDAAQVINYGLNKLRFPSPVPVDSEVTLTVDLTSVDEVPGGYQLTIQGTFVAGGQPKPVCVAEIVFRYYRRQDG